MALYIPRSLSVDGNTYTEDELLAASNYVVVLAEPGGGKTELMRSLAQKLGISSVTANVFRHVGADDVGCPLVIDAFDELAKIDLTGIHSLLANARKANPSHVIISSRSSEWDSASTNTFGEFIGCRPIVVRLCEFEETEQREIFDHHVPGEDFSAFQSEISQFDLDALLPNPQFLKLFADAYIESGRQFSDKRSIFSQAVERLSKEANSDIAKRGASLLVSQRVDLASEVFAKLLLSGAEGVCTSEAAENRMYPLLPSLFSGDMAADSILATRLFKPGDSADKHLPIHKIVAEYCAADYLIKRIVSPTDPLTLYKCLAIIAPNSCVRDELRGLLGWMAALGNKEVECTAIELDPYAILVNGDPSQLEHSSKFLLVRKLKEIEAKDPHFRRGDFLRRYSVAGFFTEDVMKEIRSIIASSGDGDLRNLILELLVGTQAIEQLKDELMRLVIVPDESKVTRVLASRCLLEIPGYSHRANLNVLISEASNTSLSIAAEIIEALGPVAFERFYLANFLRICASLYPDQKDRFDRTIDGRYFVKNFIRELDCVTAEWLLGELSKGLECICGQESYECDCRNGISKIIGFLLDHYFELSTPPYDTEHVFQWTKNLNFHESKSADQSKAVRILQSNDDLRQGIISCVLGEMTDRDKIFNTRVEKLGAHSHAGLHLQAKDNSFLVDLAFERDNPDLWASFMAGHQNYRRKKDQGPDSLRQHMRQQALQKPLFMREWAKSNRAAALFERKHRVSDFRYKRGVKRRRRQEKDMRETNIKYVQDNRELVERGRHWGCLKRFSQLVLHHPDRIEQEVGDEGLVRSSLRNCLDFITPEIPNLSQLAKLKCASQSLYVESVLLAACLEIMRVNGNLEGVDVRLLQALRTNLHVSYSAVSSDDRNELQNEVDRLIFSSAESIENFLRQYLEPQLAQKGCASTDIWLLRNDEVFRNLRSKLSIEWLELFDRMELSPLNTLFEIAAQYGDRNKLGKIILKRCVEFICCCPTPTGSEYYESLRKFWFVRAWYFLRDPPDACWGWLKTDKDHIHIFCDLSGSLNRGDKSYWPKLSPLKVEAILNAFIGEWPKVELPSSWGTGSPKEENAYRFLTDVIWIIDSSNPDDATPVLNRLLDDSRFSDLHASLRSIHASQVRSKALRDFEPPTSKEIVHQLDLDEVATVEGLRELLVQELYDFQGAIIGGEFNSVDRFYENSIRLGEVRSTEIIAERLSLRLEPKGITITSEHQLKSLKRSDFTATKVVGGKRRLLVAEVKGQWHEELYTAASAQLYERYSIHPSAEQQGIYLVIWFGRDEKVAGLKMHGIKSAQELKINIEERLPEELLGLIDVFVLDVSRKL